MTDLEHGTVTAYKNHGCRCLPCSVAGTRYERETYHGRKRLHSGWKAARVIGALEAHGHTRRSICEHTGLSRRTLSRIVNGHVERVCEATWDALNELMEDHRRPPAVVWIDPTPLLEALEYRAATHAKGLVGLLGENDARAFYRARSHGRITVPLADRLAITHLGTQLELLYGPDYDVEAA